MLLLSHGSLNKHFAFFDLPGIYFLNKNHQSDGSESKHYGRYLCICFSETSQKISHTTSQKVEGPKFEICRHWCGIPFHCHNLICPVEQIRWLKARKELSFTLIHNIFRVKADKKIGKRIRGFSFRTYKKST